ncbi:SRPBCC family protein [Nocardia sp. NEAU-G5]|uniref:SRPBCC family protein n=1 Tax=Nocardia albiluteola TaxID=2842303 RepID=A0ABS6ATX5_9NOCA|nr:SRPBCC family protein [Nocardia albiluteola]MBU3060479.1 SRPBCC family protein [Nocardia albiluteola]
MGESMIWNIHQRELPVPAQEVGALLDTVAEPGNPLWPADHWPALVLDRPLQVGADGGHGTNRYTCTAYEPGRAVEFTFGPSMPFTGTHTFEIIDRGERGCVVRHLVVARASEIRGWILWTFAIRWLHDAVLEELLDRAATTVGHPPTEPARWSPWVRMLRTSLDRVRPAVPVG